MVEVGAGFVGGKSGEVEVAHQKPRVRELWRLCVNLLEEGRLGCVVAGPVDHRDGGE